MSIVIKPFGNIGKYRIHQALMTNNSGHAVSILDFGGVLRRWMVPDRNEKVINIVLGYNTLEHYIEDPFYMGALIGRISNRVAKRKFKLNNRVYRLSKNIGSNRSANHLHGGRFGLSKRLWQMDADSKNNRLRLIYHSPDGEEGYPGRVDFRVDYTLHEEGLELCYHAFPSEPTPISLTQHFYFNLNGDGRAVRHIEEGVVISLGGDCNEHRYQILSDRYLETTAANLPTGRVLAVEDSPYDFRLPRTLLGDDGLPIDYDKHLLFLPQRQVSQPVAKAWGEKSDISLSLTTDQTGMQFYNSCNLDRKHAAFCFEPQNHPNAVNQPHFPTPMVTADNPYFQRCLFQTSLEHFPS